MAELTLDTKPLLRPTQLAEAQQERKSLQAKLHSPYIQDKGEVQRQLRRLDTSIATQTPIAYEGKQKDMAVAKEAELRAKILEGMPSHEEMRKSPPGALEKHQAWEARNKRHLLEWKNLQLRLNAGNADNSVANFEKYRPRTSTLSMDGAQITGTTSFLPPEGAERGVTFSAAQIELLASIAPDIRERLALLTNEQRASVKAILDMPTSAPEETDPNAPMPI